MSKYKMVQLPVLIDANGTPVGFKTLGGEEVFFPFYSQDGMTMRKPDGSQFMVPTAADYFIQNAAPATGQIVVMEDSAKNGTLYMMPALLLAALTVTLPSEANSVIGQVRRIATTKAITVLTVNGATTILGNVGSMALGDCISFHKIAANTWARMA